MENIIEELWNDEINPQDTQVDNNPHYKELQHLQSRNKSELLESLSEEQKEKLEKYCDTPLEMNSVSERDSSDDAASFPQMTEISSNGFEWDAAFREAFADEPNIERIICGRDSRRNTPPYSALCRQAAHFYFCQSAAQSDRTLPRNPTGFRLPQTVFRK